MMRNSRQQIPFGELLQNARRERGISRAELTRLTGISENSLLRYEKAGLEPGGQFPPGPKLAKLCFRLRISTAKALWGCLDAADFRDYEMDEETFDDLMDHPGQSQLYDQFWYIVRENATYREALRFLIADEHRCSEEFVEKEKEWVKREVKKLFNTYDNFEVRMLARGMASVVEDGSMASMPDDRQSVFDRSDDTLEAPFSVHTYKDFSGRRIKDQLRKALESIEQREQSGLRKN